MTRSLPAMKPPMAARDLEKVPMIRSTSSGEAEVGRGAGPARARARRCRGRRPPSPGRRTAGPGCTMAGRSQRSPSMEKTPSVMISLLASARHPGQLLLQVGHVVVVVAHQGALAEGAAVQDAGVDVLVHDDVLPLVHQARHHAGVGLEAGGEDQGRLLAHQVRQPALQFQVDGQGAVEEPGAGAAGAVLLDGRGRRALMAGWVVSSR